MNRTVYIEDLASTNGTKVNGIATGHQVVHHLDLIEVGKHKLHFFDDTLLAGAVGDLENTVHTDFERTMLATHVPSSGPPAPSRREAQDLSRTMAIPRDPALRGGAAPEAALARDDAQAKGCSRCGWSAGAARGEVIALDRANTMLGATGADTALVVKRGDGYFLARFGGGNTPRLNGRDLPAGAHAIAPQDVVDVGGSRYEVIQVVR